ncbi:MAG TPA: protein translocase subunit SecF [Mycobacteriales bacterium]|nr:protein translocase subunit SecF [Mycobacteriales bacterium]
MSADTAGLTLPTPRMGLRSLPHRLYAGEVSYDFVSRRRRWYALSALILVVSLASILIRGFNYGIDFKGGSTYDLPRNGHSVADATAAVSAAGVTDAQVQTLSDKHFLITTKKTTDQAQVNKVITSLSTRLGVGVNDISPSTVGGTWGSEISKKALEGLLIFLAGVVVYITLAFREFKMALSAFVALLHDLLITAGVYSLVGFEVTPSTVIALLTILGFSLYDTVVVFDKVRENTARLQSAGRVTYGQASNLALNQTLVRSINTSLIALIPVASLLFVGAGLLGAGTLKDLALAQFVGLASGAYSSIFIATPLLVQLKEREPQMKALAAKVARAEAAGKPAGTLRPAAVAATAGFTAAAPDEPSGGTGVRPSPPPRQQRRRNRGRPSGKRRR